MLCLWTNCLISHRINTKMYILQRNGSRLGKPWRKWESGSCGGASPPAPPSSFSIRAFLSSGFFAFTHFYHSPPHTHSFFSACFCSFFHNQRCSHPSFRSVSQTALIRRRSSVPCRWIVNGLFLFVRERTDHSEGGGTDTKFHMTTAAFGFRSTCRVLCLPGGTHIQTLQLIFKMSNWRNDLV